MFITGPCYGLSVAEPSIVVPPLLCEACSQMAAKTLQIVATADVQSVSLMHVHNANSNDLTYTCVYVRFSFVSLKEI